MDYVFFQTSCNVDHEQAQALTRIVMSVLVFVLFAGQVIWQQSIEPPLNYALSISLMYLLLSVPYYLFVSKIKQHCLWRRYIVITTDLCVISSGIYLLKDAGFAVYPLLLWVVIGNGLRFGAHFLKVATIIGAACFLLVTVLNDTWVEQPEVCVGLLLGLLVIPKVFLVLISKLTDANSQLHKHIWEAEHAATHDILTGLPNKLLFDVRLEHAIEHAHHEKNHIGVLFIDLDNFKSINDGLGHPTGDRVLQAVACHLTEQVRHEDTVARIAGDLFAIILEGINDSKDVAIVANKILSAFEMPIEVDDQQLHIATTIGISLYPEDGDDIITLSKNADTALYQAKDRGKNQYCFYTANFTDIALKRLQLENELRMAVKRNEFTIYYQPQYALSTNKITGAEALLRWQHPEKGQTAPGKFVSMLEHTGLIIPLGEWVLREACTQMRTWLDNGYIVERIGVNVSGQQIQYDGFAQVVRQVLEDTGLAPCYLELEVTESFIMQQAEEAISTLNELREMGVHIAIDDFGTGYSSLSYLSRLPVDRLKVDRTFVQNIPKKTDEAIAKAVIALARSLQLTVIAEGVETREQQSFLAAEGCDEVQGYYYSRPVPEKDFVKLLADSTKIVIPEKLLRRV